MVVKSLDLEIARGLGFGNGPQNNKRSGFRKSHSQRNLGESVDSKFLQTASLEMMSKESDDFFDQVECQDVGIKQKDGRMNITMQMKIITSGNRCHIMSYDLDKMREVTWLSASRDAKIFYGDSDDGLSCYVYDADLGFVDLHSKELLLEYHALDKNRDHLHLEQVEMGV